MDQLKNNQTTPIADQLESFRPGVDDLSSDAWQELRSSLAADSALQYRAEVIQRHDRAVHTAMHSVPIPAGLADRLLAKLSRVPAADVLSSAPPTTASNTVELPAAPTTAAPRSFSRRVWGTALITAAALAVLVVTLWPARLADQRSVTLDELAQLVDAWESDPTLKNTARGQDLGESGGLRSHPLAIGDFTASVKQVLGPAMRGGLSLAVYELQNDRQQTARLYVVSSPHSFDVSASPLTHVPGLTGSRAAGAWQRGEQLYVLVVNENEARLGDFIYLRGLA